MKRVAVVVAIMTLPALVGAQQADGRAQGANAAPSAAPAAPAAAPKLNVPLPPSAVGMVMDEYAPLSPSEVLEIRKRLDSIKRAAATRPTSPPKPRFSEVVIDTSPGAPAASIRVAATFGAIVNLFDDNGNAWPIHRIENFSKDDFDVVYEQGASNFTVKALSDYAQANLAIFLKDMQRGIPVFLVTAQRETDYSVDMRIPGSAPGALVKSVGNGIDAPAADAVLSSVLSGLTPSSTTQLTTDRQGVKAWKISDKRMVVRTALSLASPAWARTLRSADGTTVYDIPITPIVVVNTHDGRSQQVRIEGL